MSVNHITITPIGRLHQGADGSDQYVLMRDSSDDLTTTRAHDYLLPLVCTAGSIPGGYFCDTVRCYATDKSNEVIGVIEHRYDI